MNLRYRSLTGAVALCLPLALIAGCNRPDPATTVNFDPEKNRADMQKRAEEIRNNPNIPQNQKDAILARMGTSSQLGEAGKSSAMAAKGSGGQQGGPQQGSPQQGGPKP